MSLRAFALLAVAIAFSSVAVADICTFSQNTFYTVTAVRACFNAVPYSASVQQQTIGQLRNLAQLYSFKDESKDSGAPFYIHVDLDAELNRMAAATYTNDFMFHDDARKVFARFGDAHTVYYAPSPYRAFAVLFPYMVQVQNGGGGLVVTLQTVSITNTGASYPWLSPSPPLNLALYLGQQVAYVNGIPVVNWLQALGDSVGQSRSASTRFNGAIINGLRRGAVGVDIGLPESDLWNITLSSGQSLQIPIAVLSRAPSAGVDQFRASVAGASAVAQKEIEGLVFGPTVHREDGMSIPKAGADVSRLYDRHPGPTLQVLSEDTTQKTSSAADTAAVRAELQRRTDAQLSAAMSRMSTNIYGPNDLVLALTSSDNVTVCMDWPAQNAVLLRIQSLEGGGSTSAGVLRFALSQLLTVEGCLQLQVMRNYPRVLLDLRSNGGGIVCLRYAIESLLFPREWFKNPSAQCEPFDMRKGGPLGNIAATQSDNVRFDQISNQVATNLSWAEGSVVRSLGQAYSLYSPKGCFPAICFGGENGAFDASLAVPNPVQPTFTQLLVLTDGLCGSACSQLNTKLRWYGKSRIVGVGGNGHVMESSSFTGGNVLSWSQFSASSTADGVAPLPTTAIAGFNFNAMYTGSSSIWREFTMIPPDYMVPLWDFYSDPVYSTPTAYAAQLTASPTLAAAAAMYTQSDFTSGLLPLGAAYLQVPYAEQGFMSSVPYYAAIGALAAALFLFAGIVIIACCCCRRAAPSNSGSGEQLKDSLMRA